ncbi:cobalt-precorrin-6A reductase [Streptomyces sp. WAC06614]|uniref:cobalt-precorrin-6A reductase n=1 Tax=Streptomyces sp. WAC06614 TaxID=2487416 RepID=UPI000F77E30C|nr:cobalt-precorrin-6A reductase [Streptomyces sp. WAC06614]RSS78126.1 cobalt-precorrin-6A reductase [Streptomyces sp. WAC06614]
MSAEAVPGAAGGPAPAQTPGRAPHVLVLGGTTEARRLAEALDGGPYRVTTSLAGRVAAPALPPGGIRIGGFGGPAGLAAWIAGHGVTRLVDATHPFARRMSFHAAEAAAATGVPLLALRRPAWEPVPGDVWHRVPDLAAAAQALPDLGSRAFLTTGRTGLAAFAHLDRTWFLVRSVDPPQPPVPARTHVLLARGPFTLADERDLLRTHRIDVLVTKDSGGSATSPKLTAARETGIPVLMVTRPPTPTHVPEAPTVARALDWLAGAVS